MLKVISNQKEWNEIVRSFGDWDIYYLYEYCYSLFLHGDGNPYLIYFESDAIRICYPVFENKLSNKAEFQSLNERFVDWKTPYGYGGPLFEGEYNESQLQKFANELKKYAIDNHVVTQFIRFHPLYKNQEICKFMKTLYLKDTIFIDTTDEILISANMDKKNRNMVRKAIKNEISIEYDKGEKLADFIEIYNKVMNGKQADDYYYFKIDYFEYLKKQFQNNFIIFYAILKGKIISAAIFFYNEHHMHYHLSGTIEEYKKLASTNLLLFEAAKWANNHGIRNLHLGGGISKDDSLYGFKKQFNKNGSLPFYIGANIFNEEIYESLLELKANYDENFNRNNSFLIKYDV